MTAPEQTDDPIVQAMSRLYDHLEALRPLIRITINGARPSGRLELLCPYQVNDQTVLLAFVEFTLGPGWRMTLQPPNYQRLGPTSLSRANEIWGDLFITGEPTEPVIQTDTGDPPPSLADPRVLVLIAACLGSLTQLHAPLSEAYNPHFRRIRQLLTTIIEPRLHTPTSTDP